MTGIATAYMDSVPVVAITGNVNLDLLGLDSFQEVDITGITMPITKHNFLVKDVRKLADTIRAAFRIANSGRKGPVLVDIPKDLTAQKVEFLPPAPPEQEKHHLFPFEQRFEQALQMLEEAERPFVYAGGGVIASGASEALKTFAERLDAPVACSLMCQGGFDQTDSRYMGMLGMHGTNTAALAIKNCDLFVAVGTRFSDRVLCNAKSFAQHCPIIQIDIDSAEFNKNIDVDLETQGRRPRDFGGAEPPPAAAYACGLDGQYRCMEGGLPAVPDGVRPQRRNAAGSFGNLERPDQRRCHHLHRRGPASDVGGAVLPLPPSAPVHLGADWAQWASAWARRSAHRWPTRTRA